MASLYTSASRITVSATTTTSVTTNSWILWNATWGGSTTTSIWSSWAQADMNVTGSSANAFRPSSNASAIEYRPSEAEVRRRKLMAELEKGRAAERRIADLRAKRLLVENISPEQRESLRRHKYFDVEVQGRTYRIRWGTHGNVRQVEGGREVRSFCIQPPDVPVGDAMLAQKLLLEADEASFLKIANAREMR